MRVYIIADKSSANEMGPARRMTGSPPVQFTSVDGIPPGALPPSRISGMRPLSCEYTSSAVDGLGCPEMLAEVTAIGPAAHNKASALGWFGMRTATVEVAETAKGRVCFLGTMQVNGPGQKREAKRRAMFGMSTVT